MSIKRKKQVKCTLCSKYKWMGNSKKKLRHRDSKQSFIYYDEEPINQALEDIKQFGTFHMGKIKGTLSRKELYEDR